jgi:nitrite reductase/ring-hydroxylating ferredoxin subunit
MSNEHHVAGGERDDALPSLEQIARLDAFLEHLGAERRPAPQRMTLQETTERVIAAQLRLACAGVEEPTPQFLHALAQTVERALAQDQRRQHPMGLSRGHFLGRAAQAAAAASLVGVGAVADEVGRHALPSQALVADAGHWYDVAAADELASGQMKAFAAGGVLGYLVNERERLHAVSALCTHMGCRLKPGPGRLGLRCLCHGAQFSADGRVLTGPALERLPRIDVRVAGGRVYARGTAEDV